MCIWRQITSCVDVSSVYLVTSLCVDVNVHLETNQQNDLSVQQKDLSMCLKTSHKAVWMQSRVPGNKSQGVCGCHVYNGDKSQAVQMQLCIWKQITSGVDTCELVHLETSHKLCGSKCGSGNSSQALWMLMCMWKQVTSFVEVNVQWRQIASGVSVWV